MDPNYDPFLHKKHISLLFESCESHLNKLEVPGERKTSLQGIYEDSILKDIVHTLSTQQQPDDESMQSDKLLAESNTQQMSVSETKGPANVSTSNALPAQPRSSQYTSTFTYTATGASSPSAYVVEQPSLATDSGRDTLVSLRREDGQHDCDFLLGLTMEEDGGVDEGDSLQQNNTASELQLPHYDRTALFTPSGYTTSVHL